MIHERTMAFPTLLPLSITIAHPRIHLGLSLSSRCSLAVLLVLHGFLCFFFVFFSRSATPFQLPHRHRCHPAAPPLPSLPRLQLVWVRLHRICKSTKALLLYMASPRSLRLHGLPAPHSPGSIQRKLTLACRPPLSLLLWLVDVAFEIPKNVRLETQVHMRE